MRRLALLGLLALLGAACAAPAPLAPTPTVTLAPTLTPRPAPTATPIPAAHLDYGVHMFIANQPATTERDLRMAVDGGFHWQKSLFEWRQIEGAAKGQFDWTEADRVVRASNAAGLKIIARLDFEPMWSRADHAHNGPPDKYQDYWDFVWAFVTRYRSGSAIGRVHAIEVWNEPNLDREWGNQTINADSAADYVRLLDGAYQAAHAADPDVVVISAGLSPSGVTDGHSADDVQYLKWMYAAGLVGKYDVLGLHANTQAPDPAAALGTLKLFPDASFYFRRVEQLRQVMVDSGDAAKQVWLTEWGWTADTVHPAYAWFAVSEDKKASNIIAAFLYARDHWGPWIGVMCVWTLPDPSWDTSREEYWWAIADPDGAPREAYNLIRINRLNGLLP
jgi:polysaccharide biosynthesis protein PslG